MTRVQFWIINAVSLAVATLIACEMVSVHQLDDVTTLVQHAQAPLVQAQQAAPQIQALVQRTAVGATRDPALKDLLQKYGISVTIKPAPGAAAAIPPNENPSNAVGAQIPSSSPATP